MANISVTKLPSSVLNYNAMYESQLTTTKKRSRGSIHYMKAKNQSMHMIFVKKKKLLLETDRKNKVSGDKNIDN